MDYLKRYHLVTVYWYNLLKLISKSKSANNWDRWVDDLADFSPLEQYLGRIGTMWPDEPSALKLHLG